MNLKNFITKKENKKPMIITASVVSLVLIAGIGIGSYALSQNSSAKRYSNMIKTAKKDFGHQNYTEAISAYEEAIELDPTNVDAYIGLAEVYTEQGDIDSAMAILNEAMEHVSDSDMEEIEEAIEEVEEVAETVPTTVATTAATTVATEATVATNPPATEPAPAETTVETIPETEATVSETTIETTQEETVITEETTIESIEETDTTTEVTEVSETTVEETEPTDVIDPEINPESDEDALTPEAILSDYVLDNIEEFGGFSTLGFVNGLEAFIDDGGDFIPPTLDDLRSELNGVALYANIDTNHDGVTEAIVLHFDPNASVGENNELTGMMFLTILAIDSENNNQATALCSELVQAIYKTDTFIEVYSISVDNETYLFINTDFSSAVIDITDGGINEVNREFTEEEMATATILYKNAIHFESVDSEAGMPALAYSFQSADYVNEAVMAPFYDMRHNGVTPVISYTENGIALLGIDEESSTRYPELAMELQTISDEVVFMSNDGEYEVTYDIVRADANVFSFVVYYNNDMVASFKTAYSINTATGHNYELTEVVPVDADISNVEFWVIEPETVCVYDFDGAVNFYDLPQEISNLIFFPGSYISDVTTMRDFAFVNNDGELVYVKHHFSVDPNGIVIEGDIECEIEMDLDIYNAKVYLVYIGGESYLYIVAPRDCELTASETFIINLNDLENNFYHDYGFHFNPFEFPVSLDDEQASDVIINVHPECVKVYINTYEEFDLYSLGMMDMRIWTTGILLPVDGYNYPVEEFEAESNTDLVAVNPETNESYILPAGTRVTVVAVNELGAAIVTLDNGDTAEVEFYGLSISRVFNR